MRLRVDFKILLVKILHGVAPSYLEDLVSVLPASHYQLRRNNRDFKIVHDGRLGRLDECHIM